MLLTIDFLHHEFGPTNSRLLVVLVWPKALQTMVYVQEKLNLLRTEILDLLFQYAFNNWKYFSNEKPIRQTHQ